MKPNPRWETTPFSEQQNSGRHRSLLAL